MTGGVGDTLTGGSHDVVSGRHGHTRTWGAFHPHSEFAGETTGCDPNRSEDPLVQGSPTRSPPGCATGCVTVGCTVSGQVPDHRSQCLRCCFEAFDGPDHSGCRRMATQVVQACGQCQTGADHLLEGGVVDVACHATRLGDTGDTTNLAGEGVPGDRIGRFTNEGFDDVPLVNGVVAATWVPPHGEYSKVLTVEEQVGAQCRGGCPHGPTLRT